MNNLLHSEQANTYLRVIKRWWWLPIVFALLSASLTYAGTKVLMKKTYGASLTYQVVSGAASSATTYSANDASSDALIMTSAPVLQAAFKHLSPDAMRDPRALFAAACQADGSNRFVTCNTTSRNSRAAAAALNDLLKTFVSYNLQIQQGQFRPSLLGIQQQEQQLKREIADFQHRLSTLEQGGSSNLTDQYRVTALQSQITQDQASLSQLTVQESSLRQQMLQAEGAIRVIDPAIPSSNPVSPNPSRNAMLGMILGICVAFALIVLLEYLDDTFRSIGEVTQVTGLSVLGSVQRFEGRLQDLPFIAWRRPRSPIAESYRMVRTNIQFANVDRPTGLLLVTSPTDGDGKTTTAINLATTIAAAGRRVLLVDADLRRATATRIFGLSNNYGLSTVGMDDTASVPMLDTDMFNLKVVPAGPMPPNPAELFGSDRIRQWLENATRRFDVVIVDAPPVVSVADTRTLAALSDGVVLVISPAQSTRRLGRQARSALEAVGASVLGVVVNKASFPSDEYYYRETAEHAPQIQAQNPPTEVQQR